MFNIHQPNNRNNTRKYLHKTNTICHSVQSVVLFLRKWWHKEESFILLEENWWILFHQRSRRVKFSDAKETLLQLTEKSVKIIQKKTSQCHKAATVACVQRKLKWNFEKFYHWRSKSKSLRFSSTTIVSGESWNLLLTLWQSTKLGYLTWSVVKTLENVSLNESRTLIL